MGVLRQLGPGDKLIVLDTDRAYRNATEAQGAYRCVQPSFRAMLAALWRTRCLRSGSV
jgi:hypothetical protein